MARNWYTEQQAYANSMGEQIDNPGNGRCWVARIQFTDRTFTRRQVEGWGLNGTDAHENAKVAVEKAIEVYGLADYS